jgi:O-antigen/teichoic acid export membrane protein
MPAEMAEPPPQTAASHRASFFRQSGWLMIATVGGGIFMTAMHLLSNAPDMSKEEYGQFVAFLAVAMFIPVLPLQMVLAQQTANGLALHREHELSGLVRAAWLATFVVWLLAAIGVFLFRENILAVWKISNPLALWLILPVLLFTTWLPMFYGVLQGQQNFLWLGWSMMLHGVARFGLAALAVLVLHWQAPGMVAGILGGLTVALAIAIWPTRRIWLAPAQAFEWHSLLRQIIPLILGFGVYQFLLTADTMFVRACFNEDTSAYYGSAGTLARASMWLVGPLATVMFPKLVHAKAKAEKTDLVGVVLAGTVFFSVVGALGLWVLGPVVVGIVFPHAWGPHICKLLPWYAWAVVPLTVANVLLYNLLAHARFKVVPSLCVLAVAYAVALSRFHNTPVMVLQTLGVCNMLLLALCAYYTWAVKESKVLSLKS